MDLIIALGGFLFFLTVGFVFGKINERSHYRSIVEREAKYKNILLFNEKTPPALVAGQPFYLVNGSAVMSGDYFKQFVAGLKKIFGGRLNSYEAMMDRGRREAILRMKEHAASHGASLIFNVHLTTSTLGQKQGKQGPTCAEFLAYGTAWVRPKPASTF